MKKLLLSVLLGILGIGMSHAATPELTFDFSSSKKFTCSPAITTDKAISAKYKDTDYTFTFYGPDNCKFNNSGYFMFGKSGAYITFPAFDFAVEKIVVTGNSGASAATKMNMFVGETAVSSETTGSAETNTYEIAADYQAAGNIYTLKVTSKHNAQVTKIEVYKKANQTPDVNYVAKPAFDPNGGRVLPNTKVAVSTTTEGATIHVCKLSDLGTEEATAENVYMAGAECTSFVVDESTTYYAVATKDAENFSEVASADFVVADADAIEEILTVDNTKVSGTAYKIFEYTSDNGIKYAICGCLSNGRFQFNNSTSRTCGIVVTENPGYALESIVLEWDEERTDNQAKEFDVYYNTTAFTVKSTDNTLGSIFVSDNKLGTTKNYKFNTTGNYSYVGITPSVTGATYPKKVIFIWKPTTQKVTFGSVGMSTFCPLYGDMAIPTGVTAYTATVNDDHSVVTLSPVTGTVLPKGCGVVLEGEAGQYYTFTLSNDEAATLDTDNLMVGVSEANTNPGTVYALGVNNGVATFGRYTGTNFPVGKAYLNISYSANNAPLRVVKGDATGIENVMIDTEEGDAYNVLGQKATNGYKGLVIKNGKKMIVK